MKYSSVSGQFPLRSKPSCVFCQIVARDSLANIRYEDSNLIVIDNILDWAPVMLLVIPKAHLTQEEMWGNGVMAKVGKVAVDWGNKLCPDGFRILSNVRRGAMQSQEHGHVHVVGGRFLGRYV